MTGEAEVKATFLRVTLNIVVCTHTIAMHVFEIVYAYFHALVVSYLMNGFAILILIIEHYMDRTISEKKKRTFYVWISRCSKFVGILSGKPSGDYNSSTWEILVV
jgi:hypothetical protein